MWNIAYNVHCVKNAQKTEFFSGPYFPTLGLNTERYSVSLRNYFECGKIQTRKTPYLDTFHAVVMGNSSKEAAYTIFYVDYVENSRCCIQVAATFDDMKRYKITVVHHSNSPRKLFSANILVYYFTSYVLFTCGTYYTLWMEFNLNLYLNDAFKWPFVVYPYRYVQWSIDRWIHFTQANNTWIDVSKESLKRASICFLFQKSVHQFSKKLADNKENSEVINGTYGATKLSNRK